MFRILLFVLLTSACSWETELAFVKVRSVSNGVVVIGSESFVSHDGGRTWERTPIPFPQADDYDPFERRDDHSVLPGGEIYAAADRELWYSPDLGRSWVRLLEMGRRGYVSGVFFFDRERGLSEQVMDAPRNESGVFLTRDGGRSWSILEVFGGRRISSVAADGDRVFVLAGEGLWRSSDQGETWEMLEKIHSRPTPTPRSITLVDDTLWMTGRRGFCEQVNHRMGYRRPCGLETDKYLFEVAAQGSKRIITASHGTLFISADGGVTWSEKEFEGKHALVSADFLPGGGAITAGGRLKDLFGYAGRILIVSEDLKTWKRIDPSLEVEAP